MASLAEKRALREKGHTSYNPKEGFGLRVHWILRNPEVAEGMLKDGLQACAKATARDTPCVPLYFFRKAYDQRPAKAFDEQTKTLADHPHYSKIFKSLEMGIPMGFQQAKLVSAGIDPAPLSWGAATVLDVETKKKIGFDPVSVSLSEYYLDSRSFYEHADSADYMKGYETVMQGHRSLDAKTRCIGTPTTNLFETVLESFLKTEMISDSILAFDQSLCSGGPCVFFECAILVDGDASWKDIALSIFNSVKAPIRSAAMIGDELQLETAFPASETTIQALCQSLSSLTVRAGQMFAFPSSEGNAGVEARPDGLPKTIQFYKPSSDTFGRAEDGSCFWTGYIIHPLASKLVADETVTWKGLNN